MRILFVAHSGKISGGANRSLLSIISGLRDEYKVIPSVLIPEPDSPLSQACAALNIPVYVGHYHSCCTVLCREIKDMFRLAKLVLAPFLDRLEACRLSRTLPGNFDCVYTNDRMTVIGGFLADLWKKPHIWHMRCFSKQNKTIFPLGWYRLIDRYANRVIVISQALRSDFVPHMAASKVKVVYNGLEISQYKSSERISHQGFNILLTGRIIQQKGQDEAVQALDALVHEYGVDAHLFFAGEIPSYGRDRYLRQLRSEICSRSLEERVVFLNEVKDMTSIRQKMDVELVCSWMEAFGRVSVEAMLAGLPVVGTNCGGTAEIIKEGETGFLYPPHDSKKLAEHLVYLSHHSDEAMKMGVAGRKRAEWVFSQKKMIDNIMEVIHEIQDENAEKNTD